MPATFDDILRDLGSGATDAFSKAFAWGAGDDASRSTSLSTLLRPVDPYNRWPFLAPVVGAAGAAALVALSGVAIAAFAVMMAALAMIWFLLSEIFGFELELGPMAPR